MNASSHPGPLPDESMTRSYDALTVEAIAQSAVDQAQAVTRAELQDPSSAAWFYDRYRAVAALCDGRPLHHMLSVGEVLASLDGRVPTTMPLTMTWDGVISGPAGDGPGEATLVACTTSRGGQTALALTVEERLALGGQLLATLHTAEACLTPGCGTPADELDASDPEIWGWICAEVAGVEGPARWWSSAACLHAAIAAAAAELAAVDEAVEADLVYLDTQHGEGAADEYLVQVAEASEVALEDERGRDADEPEDGDDLR
ncbi:hypothetical protein [Streptomyces sp. NPDC050535]|uniref:hypothetical protein n=1 Tax=Streptomyces sp. NPDC050535 TaxID=3365626 RepID=UPI0037899810